MATIFLVVAVVATIFLVIAVASHFAIRGGTAVNKLSLASPIRHSEDIDVVQVLAGPTRPIFKALRARLDPWLGGHTYEHREHSAGATWSFSTEAPPSRRMQLKVEASTREHFTAHGLVLTTFRIESRSQRFDSTSCSTKLRRGSRTNSSRACRRRRVR